MLEKYRALLSHLNAEENDLALEFEATLVETTQRLDKLDALEVHGVDNWVGYDDAMGDEDE